MPPARASSPPAPSDAASSVAAQRVLVRLLAATGMAMVLIAGLSAGLIAATHRRSWWDGWVAALIVSVVAAAVSLVPVAAGVFAGARFAAYGYLAGAVIRILITLAGGMVAVMMARTPAAPTLLLLVPLYFGQLLAEATVLCRAFWPVSHDSESSSS